MLTQMKVHRTPYVSAIAPPSGAPTAMPRARPPAAHRAHGHGDRALGRRGSASGALARFAQRAAGTEAEPRQDERRQHGARAVPTSETAMSRSPPIIAGFLPLSSA